MGAAVLVEIDPIDERIRHLCAKAASVRGPEVETVLFELRLALKETFDTFGTWRLYRPSSICLKTNNAYLRSHPLHTKLLHETGRHATLSGCL